METNHGAAGKLQGNGEEEEEEKRSTAAKQKQNTLGQRRGSLMKSNTFGFLNVSLCRVRGFVFL